MLWHLNPQLFCQQIDQKNTLWQNELLYMFFHRCSYKYSCFSELAYNSSVQCSYFKNVALDFALLVLKLYSFQVVISDPLWIKTHDGPVIAPFPVQLLHFFSYVAGALVTNLFSLLLIDIFWLFSKL